MVDQILIHHVIPPGKYLAGNSAFEHFNKISHLKKCQHLRTTLVL